MAAVVRLHRWGDVRYGGFALKAGLNAAGTTGVLAERRVGAPLNMPKPQARLPEQVRLPSLRMMVNTAESIHGSMGLRLWLHLRRCKEQETIVMARIQVDGMPV